MRFEKIDPKKLQQNVPKAPRAKITHPPPAFANKIAKTPMKNTVITIFFDKLLTIL